MIYGYARVSTTGQDLAQQLAQLTASVTSWAVMVSLIDQPTTLRENRSMTAAT